MSGSDGFLAGNLPNHICLGFCEDRVRQSSFFARDGKYSFQLEVVVDA